MSGKDGESTGPELLDLSGLLGQPSEHASTEPEPVQVGSGAHLHTLESLQAAPPSEAVDPLEPRAPLEHLREVVAPRNVVDEIADFARSTTIGNPPVVPRVPHTLRISGLLAPHHRQRLLDIVKESGLGLREMDLEPQLESGQIMLTRISEYTGVQIIQALRDAQVRMSLTADAADPDLLSSS